MRSYAAENRRKGRSDNLFHYIYHRERKCRTVKLEQPKVNQSGDLAERVRYLENYIFRLHGELQAALNYIEKNLPKEGNR